MATDDERHDPRPNEARWRLRQQKLQREIRARRTYTPGVASSSRGEPVWTTAGEHGGHGSGSLTPVREDDGEAEVARPGGDGYDEGQDRRGQIEDGNDAASRALAMRDPEPHDRPLPDTDDEDDSTGPVTPAPLQIRDDVMMGKPDSEPVKRPAPVSVEDLRTSVEAEREQAVGTQGLSWVGICDGHMYADWLTQLDKNEAPGLPVTDPDAGEHELHFERDVKDNTIAQKLGGGAARRSNTGKAR